MAPFEIVFSVAFKTDFHISGTGRMALLVDRCVESDWNGQPYIPASSIRGRVRAHLESLLRAWGHRVCDSPNPATMCPPGTQPCLVCQMMGGPSTQSRVFFSRLTVDSEGTAKPVVRTGVGINRALNTVEQGRLFLSEVVPPVRYTGTVNGWLNPQELAYLVCALQMLTHLGGEKARGLGRLDSVAIERLTYDGEPIEWRTLLQEVSL